MEEKVTRQQEPLLLWQRTRTAPSTHTAAQHHLYLQPQGTQHLYWYHACMWCTYVHAGKTFRCECYYKHLIKINNVNTKLN